MSSHNHAKKLEKLESLLFETLSKEQKVELKVLKHLKKKMDEIQQKFGTVTSYYDKKGKHMSFWEWGGYNNDGNYKIINQHTYGDFFISTVWIGIDLGFPSNSGHPVIFETMIFVQADREHELQDYQERHCTETEAIKGHIKASQLANKAAGKDLSGKLTYLNKEMEKTLKEMTEDYKENK